MEFKPSTRFPEILTDSLSILDFEKCLDFYVSIMEKWGDDVSTHMKVGEDGFALSSDKVTVRNLIIKSGGYEWLDYMSATYPSLFTITADFSKGQLRIRAKDKALLSELERLWRSSKGDVRASEELFELSLSTEAKKFILRCVNEEGSLIEAGQEKLPFDKSHVLLAHDKVGLQPIIRHFGQYLTRNQNEDGGWGYRVGEKSQVAPTASSLIFLIKSSLEKEFSSVVEKGATFLANEQNSDGSWVSNGTKGYCTAIAAIGISLSQKYPDRIAQSVPWIKEWISHAKPGDLDHTIFTLLGESSILDEGFMRSIAKRFVCYFEQHDESKYTLDVISLSTVLVSLSMIRKTRDEPLYKRAVQHLSTLRNKDGGWPPNKGSESSLSATILALSTIEQTKRSEISSPGN